MKGPADWGAWLSIAAVAVVGLAIALQAAPGPAPGPGPAPAPAERSEPVILARAEPLDAGAPVEEARPGPFYRLDAPDVSLELSKVLAEISGLSATSDSESLWAVHDERGTLFRIAIKDGAVLEQIPLGKRGDYEGVEQVGDRVYVARSEGVLFVVDPRGGGKVTRLDFLTDLGLACDLEGLAHESRAKRLLLTCKNESSKSRQSNKAFEIYAMDLDTLKVKKEPAYVLNEQAIDDYIAAHPEQTELKLAKGKTFAPSGIAVHPATGEVYVSSTRGKMLVVLAPSGALVRVYALDPKLHAQPEGITFVSDGTLFISNEAHGKRAMLFGFRAQTGRAAQQ